MLDFHTEKEHLFLIRTNAIILLNGDKQVSSMYHPLWTVKDVALLQSIFSPRDKEDLFNLCYAQAQNTIECIFGVLKQHFYILLYDPEYQSSLQALIPAALATLHNFI